MANENDGPEDRRVVLNPRNVAKLSPPPSDKVIYYDATPPPASPPGFGVRVTASGSRSYTLDYRLRGRSRRLTLGKVGAVALAGARAAARTALEKVAKGVDPLVEKHGARGNTLAALAEDYLASKEVQRLRRKDDYVRTVRREIIPAFGDLEPAKITRTDIRAWAEKIHARAPFMANAALAVLRRMLRWAVEHERLGTLPVFPAPPEPLKARDRVLTEDEIRSVWKALDAEEERGNLVGPAFKLMLVTGQRRSEVLSMRWADVSGSWWTLRETKSGRSHRVWLTAPALAILDKLRTRTGAIECVFPSRKTGRPLSPNHGAERLWESCAVEDGRLHDFRRTAASFMGSLGVSRLILARVLNHADRSVTAVYDRHSYDVEKIAAWEKWGDELGRILRGEERKPGQIVPITTARA